MKSVAGKTTWLYLIFGPLLAAISFSAVHLLIYPDDRFLGEPVVENVVVFFLRAAFSLTWFVPIAAGLAIVGRVFKSISVIMPLALATAALACLWIANYQTLADPQKNYMQNFPYFFGMTVVPTLMVWMSIRVIFGPAGK